jgi:hypothetical protein
MFLTDCAKSALHIYTNGTTNGHGYSGSSTNDNSGSDSGIGTTDGGIGATGVEEETPTNTNASGQGISGGGSNVKTLVISVTVTMTITVSITIIATVRVLRWRAAQQTMPPPQPEFRTGLTTTQMFVSNLPDYSMEGAAMPMLTSPNPRENNTNNRNVGYPALHDKP